MNQASYVLWSLAYAIYHTYEAGDAEAAWQMIHLLGALRDDNEEAATTALMGLDELVGIRTIAIDGDGQ